MKKFTLALMAMLAFSFSLKAQMYVSTTPAHRNVILEEFTGRNCQYCPDGHAIANQISADHPGRFWAVNVHAGGYAPTSYPNFNTTDGTAIASGFQIDGYPAGVVNRSTPNGQSRGAWESLANSQMNQTAECNVAGAAVVNPLTRTAAITVEVYYTGNSTVNENYLSVAMVQDSILGSQSGGSTWNPSQMIGNQYVHMHVLRDIITDTWGDAISPTTQGTLITRTYQYQIPETIGNPNGVAVDLNNIHFYAWVSERSQTYDYTYQGQQYHFTAIRPILNACELEYIQGVDEPVHPIVTGVGIDGLYECTQSKSIKISLQNIGTGAITSMSITAEFAGETYNEDWEGDLQPYGKEIIMIPVTAPFGTQDIAVSITEANGEPYEFTSTTSVTIFEWSDLVIEGEEEVLKLQLMQDKFGNQITWEFTAADGTVLGSGGPYDVLAGGSATQIHVENVVVPVNECVKFTIRDSMGDGICCTSGNGYYIVKNSHNQVIFGNNSDGNFGEEASHLISVKSTEGVVENEQTVRIYPNPTMGVLNIEGEDMTSVEVYNTVGQRILMREVNGNAVQLNTEGLSNGLYIVRIHASNGTMENHTFSVAR
ncbi:MAG: Omp28-related outer membrane protein [Bacteroidales bacterium]|nr:Omp28-related outer membrane protein [Bacteroidales bacterium]